MKIYQLHVNNGYYDDYLNHIHSTYLDREKAEAKKIELERQEEIDRKCDGCPLWFCPKNCTEDCDNCGVQIKVSQMKEYCDRCDAVIKDGEIECRNYSYHIDDNDFEIVEVEVIE